ncbi:HNH endonuclease [Georgenia sp. EYE_87]|uniref:HNH endonuclease signature motif containing protein n=1 Tax=Georgenia sp. EYE_87 TaxID=2853448 RepID=UPI002002A6B8|nr:HNH endonuclease signature motif containing protein [Georgenia sp. EYE_87]MCK6211041.1 HNH endonuclease [Georgenia sp. EYE_87]
MGAALSREEETAGLLAEAAPDGELFDLLLAVEPDEVDDYAAVEVVAAFKRVEAAAAAAAARAAAALAGRDSMHGQLPTRRAVRELDFAADELAMRLGMTRGEARKVVDLGEAFTGVLAETGEALARGEIDARKAGIIVSALSGRAGPVAWGVQAAVLPEAGRRTHPQLQRDINKALVQSGPEDAHDRGQRAARERHVTHLEPGLDGMASLRVVAPAHELVVVDAALQAAAVGARAAGDSRSTDQLRADALVAMSAAALAAGRIGPASGPSGPTGVFDLSDRIKITVTVPLSVALPPELDHTGLRTTCCGASTGVRALAGAGTETRTVGEEAPGAGSEPTRAGGGPGAEPPGRAPSPMDTYGDEPDGPVAMMDGVGAITPEVARALAAGGTWRRVVLDPFSGTVLDVGRTTYRPPADLARLVRERDGTCVAPGCSVPATSCQLDHTVSWANGGPTAEWNLGPLCERDHPLKSCGAFTVEQPAPGEFVWTTPSGHRYRRTPDGRVTTLPREGWEADPEPPF